MQQRIANRDQQMLIIDLEDLHEVRTNPPCTSHV